MPIRPVKDLLLTVLLMGVLLYPADAETSSLRYLPREAPNVETMDPGEGLRFPLRGIDGAGETGAISKKKAVFYSLLLPGLGDYYLGRKNRAKIFFLTEAAAWTSFIVLQVQGHLREDAYKEFAVAYGSISRTDHSQDYFKLLTQFNSSDEYEEAIKWEGRYFLYPNADREALDNYFLSKKVSDFEPWQWPSDEKRREYRKIRTGSRLARRRAIYSVATAVANRIVSFVFTLKAVQDLDPDRSSSIGGFHLQFGYPYSGTDEPYRTGVIVSRSF